jgi:hypothetical protein
MSLTTSRSFFPIAAVVTATAVFAMLYIQHQQHHAAQKEQEAPRLQDKENEPSESNQKSQAKNKEPTVHKNKDKSHVRNGEEAAYITNDQGLLLSSTEQPKQHQAEEKLVMDVTQETESNQEKPKVELNPLVEMWKKISNKQQQLVGDKDKQKFDNRGDETSENAQKRDSFEKVEKPENADTEGQVTTKPETKDEKKPFWSSFLQKPGVSAEKGVPTDGPSRDTPKEEAEDAALTTKTSDDEKGIEATKLPPPKGFFGFGIKETMPTPEDKKESNQLQPPARKPEESKEGERDKEDDSHEVRPQPRMSFFGFGQPVSPTKKSRDESSKDGSSNDAPKSTTCKSETNNDSKTPSDESKPKKAVRRNIFGFEIAEKDLATSDTLADPDTVRPNEEDGVVTEEPSKRNIFGFEIPEKTNDRANSDQPTKATAKDDQTAIDKETEQENAHADSVAHKNEKKGFWGVFVKPKEAQHEMEIQLTAEAMNDKNTEDSTGEAADADKKPQRQSFLDSLLNPNGKVKGSHTNVAGSSKENVDTNAATETSNDATQLPASVQGK